MENINPAQAEDFARYARNPETWAVAAARQLAVVKHLFERGREVRLSPEITRIDFVNIAGYNVWYAIERRPRGLTAPIRALPELWRGDRGGGGSLDHRDDCRTCWMLAFIFGCGVASDTLLPLKRTLIQWPLAPAADTHAPRLLPQATQE